MLSDEVESADWWLLRLGRQLRERQPNLDYWWDMYKGKHRLPELPRNVGEAFREFQRKSRTNFLGTVANAPVHRLRALGITDGAGNEDADAARWWQLNRLDSRQKQVYRVALSQSVGYMMVGPHPTRTEANGRPSPLITAETPGECIVEHDPATGERRAGLKAWYDDVARVGRAMVFVGDDTLVRYVTKPRGPGRLPWGRQAWEHDGDEETHDLGGLPLIDFPCRPDLGEDPEPEFAGVIDIQDRLNLGVLNRMTAGRYAAFRQKYVTGHKFRKRTDPMTGLEVVEQPFVPSPSAVWASEGENVKFGQLDATDLSGFLKEHEADIRNLLLISNTPAYYFATDLINISADTVQALDVLHLAKIGEHQAFFGEALEDVMTLCARQAGVERDFTEAEVRWADARQLNPAVLADAATKKKAIGYPLTVLAEDMGESPQRVRRIAAGAAADALLGASLLPPQQPAAAAGTGTGTGPGDAG
ncbi:phage portal protein [Streptomyces griseofuscus]|uniref:phage portal protein n=1 Tax=Streptomyces griseofuscus TaxID=146922 RepID=UPI0037A93FA2